MYTVNFKKLKKNKKKKRDVTDEYKSCENSSVTSLFVIFMKGRPIYVSKKRRKRLHLLWINLLYTAKS